MIIKSLFIEKFRSFTETQVPLSKGLTLIAGQNGTGKSTILGMIGQPFRFDTNDELKDFFGLKANTEFSDIFKFSVDKDIPGEHIYHLNVYDTNLHPDGENIQVKSQKRQIRSAKTGKLLLPNPNRPSTFIRLVTGKKRGSAEGGNIENIPVVYLGLSRLFPIGESITNPYDKEIEDTVKKDIIRKHKHVLCLNHIKARNENLRSVSSNINKIHIGYENDRYDTYTNSAGQDNVSKILTAMAYLSKLKNILEEKNKYKGAFLLIDELDATLFPASQDKLVERLIDFANRNKVQIIATTHSPNMLEFVTNKYKNKEDLVQIVYLRSINNEGKIEITPSPSMEFINNNLKLIRSDNKEKIKVSVFREDEVTEKFIKQLLGSKISSNLAFEKIDFGFKELGKLSKYKWSLFQNAVFVVDGEVPDEYMNTVKNTVRLPGGERPEFCIYDTIYEIDDEHDFWDVGKGRIKQQCFENCPNRNAAKEWFDNLPSQDKTAFIHIWMRQIPERIEEFKANFISLYNKQAKKIGAKEIFL
jgi:hypothetical protein